MHEVNPHPEKTIQDKKNTRETSPERHAREMRQAEERRLIARLTKAIEYYPTLAKGIVDNPKLAREVQSNRQLVQDIVSNPLAKNLDETMISQLIKEVSTNPNKPRYPEDVENDPDLFRHLMDRSKTGYTTGHRDLAAFILARDKIARYTLGQHLRDNRQLVQDIVFHRDLVNDILYIHSEANDMLNNLKLTQDILDTQKPDQSS